MSVDAAVVAVPSLGLVKMEDRKRASDHDESAAPPLKRQATLSNGAGAEEKPDAIKFGTHSSPWQVELETYQKDALIRQMREFKREKTQLEQQVAEMEKRSKYHDDHIRIIDAWLSQLMDEVKVLAGSAKPLDPMPNGMGPSDHPLPLPNPIPLAVSNHFADELNPDASPFASSLIFAESEKFQEHLFSRSAGIKTALTELYGRLPEATPDTRQLQEQVSKLLAAEKKHIVELQHVTSEKEQLAERLENASYRYLVAEKKLDRSKSVAVAFLEMQGQMQSQQGGEQPTAHKENPNGSVESGAANEEAEAARRAAVAIAAKLKEQLDALEVENKKLTEEFTSATSRLHSLGDDDYAKTELFKALRSQHEDVIKRVNHLEATNVQLRDEAQKLQAERNAYRIQMDEESRTTCSEVEAQLAKADLDLQRIRAARDDLQAKNAILESSQSEHKLSLSQMQQLKSAADDMIAALESQVERLRLKLGETQPPEDAADGLESLTVEELRSKVAALKTESSMLGNELTSMGSAFMKFKSQATKKVSEIAAMEDQVLRLSAEKAKADQKYFAAMKAKEAREVEYRMLRTQNHKSSEIISQLKDAEAKTRELCSNLEKQLTEHRDAVSAISDQSRHFQQKNAEAKMLMEGLNAQLAELKKSLTSKDTALMAATHSQREADVELEGIKAKLSDAKKKTEEWRIKARSNPTEEVEMLRRVAYCGACQRNLKDTMIKGCNHILCQDCVKERIQNRMRKCPHCLKAFGINDYVTVHLV